MRSEFRTVSADDAQSILDAHVNPRNPSIMTVRAYARDMESGKWRSDTHQGLGFDDSGVLVDGQHRLMAQVLTGKTLRWWCTYGVSRDSVATMDVGKRRTVSFQLGESKTHVAVANILHRFLHQKAPIRTVDEQRCDVDMYRSRGPFFDAVCARGGTLSAAYRAGFVFAWPASPDLVESYWEALPEKGRMDLLNLEALRNVAKIKSVNRMEQLEKSLSVLHACISGRSLATVKPSAGAIEFFKRKQPRKA